MEITKMDSAEQTMVNNIEKITGKSVSGWIKIVEKSKLIKHGEIVKMLKVDYSFTHGYANFIAHKALKSDAGSADSATSLIEEQYKGEKQVLLPIYDLLMKVVKEFGKDVIVDPKKAYVSLKRKKQFALFQPTTKTRIDIGVNLKGKPATNRLELSGGFSAMCSHRIRISHKDEVDSQLIDWLRTAYEAAG